MNDKSLTLILMDANYKKRIITTILFLVFSYVAPALEWKPVEPTGVPYRRYFSSFANAGKGRLLLFGGIHDDRYLKDLWLFDIASGQWKQLPDDNFAIPLAGAACTFLNDDEVIFHGGCDKDYIYSSFFKYHIEKAEWSIVYVTQDTVPPPPRLRHKIVFDGEDTLVLFGGNGGVKGYLDDTWIYRFSTQTWKEIKSPDTPRARRDYDMVYTKNNKVLLSGGDGDGKYLNDLWEFDVQTGVWTQLQEDTWDYKFPSPRSGHSLAFVHDAILLTGGSDYIGYMSDTWIYWIEKQEWEELFYTGNPVPPARILHQTIVTEDERIFLFGGHTINGADNSLFEFDWEKKKWTPYLAFQMPERLENLCLLQWDNQSILLLGGNTLYESKTKDMLTLDTRNNTWRDPGAIKDSVSSCEIIKKIHGIDRWATNGQNQGIVLTSYIYAPGSPCAKAIPDGNSFLNTIHTFDAAQNRRETITLSGLVPSLRKDYAMAFAGGNKLVLFGGDRTVSGMSTKKGKKPELLDDTWIIDLDSGTCESKTMKISPAPRRGSEMVQLDKDKLLLFGGETGDGKKKNDLWLYNIQGAGWQEQKTIDPPSPRSGHRMVVLDGKVLLFGGDRGNEALDDTWLYDNKAGLWQQLFVKQSPGPRCYQGMFLSDDENVYITGGRTYMKSGKVDLLNNSFALDVSGILHPKEPGPEIHVQLARGGSDAVMSHDGKFFLSVSGSDIALWDVLTGKEIRSFKGHKSVINSLSFSPCGKYALSGSGAIHLGIGGDDSVRIWDILTGEELQLFNNHKNIVTDVFYSPDGKKIYSTDYDETKVWDPYTNKEYATCKWYYIIDYARDGSMALYAKANTLTLADLSLADLSTGSTTIKKWTAQSESITSVALSPDKQYALSGDSQGNISLWKVPGGELITQCEKQPDSIYHLCFSPSGSSALSCAGTHNKVSLREMPSCKEVQSYDFDKSFTYISSIGFSSDEKSVYISGNDKIILFEKDSGIRVREFFNRTDIVDTLAQSHDGRYLYTGSYNGGIHKWDLQECKLSSTFTGHEKDIKAISLTLDDIHILSGSENNILLWDSVSGRIEKEIKRESEFSKMVQISGNEDYALIADGKTVKIYDFSTWEKVQEITAEYTVSVPCFTPDSNYILVDSSDLRFGEVDLYEIKSGKKIRTFPGYDSPINAIAVSPDSQYVCAAGWRGVIKVWDYRTGKEHKTLKGHTDGILSVCFSKDSRTILSGSMDQTIRMWDIATGNQVKIFRGHTGNVNSAIFTFDGTRIISGSHDCTTRIWDISTGEWIALVSSLEKNEWLIYTEDGYWDSSRNGGDLVAMVKGLESFNIDQFALRNNRPDLILLNLGITDKKLINHYYSQYMKRLKKLGFQEKNLSNELHVPEAKIKSAKQNGKMYELVLSLNDTKYPLKSYNIFINDVPLFGSYGRKITGKKAEIKETVELLSGENKIEASCMNSKGIESYRALTHTAYDKKTKGDLYFLAFGVSTYKNPDLNLKYAHKDVQDLEKMFMKMKGGYGNVYNKTYTDKAVTVKNIQNAKSFLNKAKIDDTFILFISGHGLHDTDTEATYYYLTYDTDIRNLKKTAANFELIEDILQGITPRKKLFLMDTCESGEVDEDSQEGYYMMADSKGLKARTPGKGITIRKGKKRAYLFDRERYIYNDLVRRSGAIVFSSCKGGEFSYESSKYENGLFTEELLNGIDNAKADRTKMDW